MEFVILGLLITQSMTLYEINREFKQNISLFYSASLGSLQVAIKNLLQKGWIIFEAQVEKGRNKKLYSITPTGREAFFGWMASETPISKLEVVGLSKVYFMGLVEDNEQKKAILRELITKIDFVLQHLHGMEDEISRYEIPETYKSIARYRVKTLDYGIGAHQFARTWFAELLAELDTATHD